MIVRPKRYVLYTISTFLGDAKCYIDCFPQQRWDCRIDGDMATISRKGVAITLPKEEIDKRWAVVD